MFWSGTQARMSFHCSTRAEIQRRFVTFPYFAISANLALLHPDFELHCDDLFDHCFSKGKECFGDIGKTIQRRIALARCRREALSAQLQRQLKRTITTLSHEFRTPLVSILTGAEILKDTLKEDERDSVVELVASVHRGGKRLESLVNDFILLQKNILGKPATYTETAPHRTPLFPIVSEAVQHFVDYLDSEISALPEIRLIHEISDSNSAGLVEVFDEQITDVLKRLLANAYTFGGNAGPIEVRVSYKEREAQVSIRDHGPGFESDKELQEIFDPFRQFHREKREQQGCGLGLTISQLLASLNGVRLSMTRPEEGSGAVANLWFELIEEKSAERECGARI